MTLSTAAAIGATTLLVAGLRKFYDSKPKKISRLLKGMNFDDKLPYPKKPTGKYLYHWARKFLDFEQLTQGSMMIGAPGSGKTISMKLLLKGILPRIQNGENVRAVIYDSKPICFLFYSHLVSMSIKLATPSLICEINVMN